MTPPAASAPVGNVAHGGGNGKTPPSAVFFSPEELSPSGSSPVADADVRQQQRYLDYLLRCQQQGVQPAPEVTAMAHEIMARTREALLLATSVRSVEQQLGIGTAFGERGGGEEGPIGPIGGSPSSDPMPQPPAAPAVSSSASMPHATPSPPTPPVAASESMQMAPGGSHPSNSRTDGVAGEQGDATREKADLLAYAASVRHDSHSVRGLAHEPFASATDQPWSSLDA